MPPSISDFPEEMQEAFFIYGLLSDRVDGAGGIYLGKDWTAIPLLLESNGYTSRASKANMINLIAMLERIYRDDQNAKAAAERKKQERKGKAGMPISRK